MATVPKSFKQQCPSCEAMVPVRDPQLIGKKIDCPKCKYRFVVEEPADDEEDAPKAKKGDKSAKADDKVSNKPAAKNGKAGVTKDKSNPKKPAKGDEDAKPSKKKAGGSNMMLILGIGLAAVALVAIVVCVVVFMSGGEKKPDNPSPGGGMANNTPQTPANNDNKDKQGENQPAAPVFGNATNLLPNKSQVVISYPMDRTLGSALKTAGLESPGAFKRIKFEAQLGMSLDDVSRILTAMNTSEDWVFTVVRTKKPIKPEDMKSALRLELQPKVKGKSGKMHDVYLARLEFDSLGTMLVRANRPRDTFAVHFSEDKHTLVVADIAPMKKFLEDDGKPDYRTKPPAPPTDPGQGGTQPPGGAPPGGAPPGGAPPGGAPPGGAPPGGAPPGVAPGGAPRPAAPGNGDTSSNEPAQHGLANQAGAVLLPPSGMVGQGGGRGGPGTAPPGMIGGGPPVMQPPDGDQPGGGQPGTAPPPPVLDNWLTVDPALKTILDRIEQEEENRESRKKEIASCLTVAFDTRLQKFDLFGKDLAAAVLASIPQFKEQKKLDELLAEVKPSVRNAGFSIVAVDQSTFNVLVVAELSSAKVASDKKDKIRKELVAQLPDYSAHGLKLGLASPPQQPGGGFDGNQPGFGMLGGPPGGMVGGAPPGGAPPGAVPPGVVQPGGGGRGGRGENSSDLANRQRPGPPGGMMGGPPPGAFQPGGGMTGVPPGGFPPGGFPGGQPGQNEKTDGTIKVEFEDRLLVIHLELTLNAPAYKALMEVIGLEVNDLKCTADLSVNRSWVHDLASAVKNYVALKGEFPRGALPRSGGDRTLPYRPDQRLSLFASLVPLLGEEYSDWRFDLDQSWNEGKNLIAAQRIVPQLLQMRQIDPVASHVRYPGIEKTVGTGHFVGVAGLGLDAAEYATDDASTAKKRGIFGYDRVTRKDDVKDGLDQTIALLLISGKSATPWLAGGGSTVRGVADDETNPLEPFVCMVYPARERKSKWDGKRGTLAIMGDGKVRFIPADLPAATFRALCTIDGGDKILSRLDDVAPVIENPNERELKTDTPISLPKPVDTPKDVASTNKGKLEGTKWTNNPTKMKLPGQEQIVDLPADAIALEYKTDGTFTQTMKGPNGTVVANGKFTFGAGDEVIMETISVKTDQGEIPLPPEAKKKESVKMVIKDDVLTITQQGLEVTFKKVK